MSARSELTTRTPPASYRLLEVQLMGLPRKDAERLTKEILDSVRSGSSQLMIRELVNVATTAVRRLALAEGVDPADLLCALWPPRKAVA